MGKTFKIIVAAVLAVGIASISAPFLWGDEAPPLWVRIDNFAFLFFLAASAALLVIWLVRSSRSTKRPSRPNSSGGKGEPKGKGGRV